MIVWFVLAIILRHRRKERNNSSNCDRVDFLYATGDRISFTYNCFPTATLIIIRRLCVLNIKLK